MADDITPNLGLTQPEVGSSNNSWGDKLNDNWGIVDGLFSGFGLVPTGAMLPFGGSQASAPKGWLYCDGREVDRTEYTRLFTVLGTTFNLPDGRGRTMFANNEGTGRLTSTGGLDGDTVGAEGGSDSVTLTDAQMPSHNHSFSDTTSTNGNHSHGNGSLYAGTAGNHNHGNGSLRTSTAGHHNHGITAGPPGSTGNTGVQWITTGQTFTADTHSAGSHSHSIDGSTSTNGNHTHSIGGSTSGSGSHSHTVSGNTSTKGSDDAHSNVPPGLVVGGWIIKA